MKKLVVTSIIFVCLFSNCARAQSKNDSQPLISIAMDTTLVSNENFTFYGKDSIVEGIDGKAKYFSGSGNEDNYIHIKNTETLSALWKDRDFSIELWVQTKAKNDKFQVIASNKDWNSGEIKDYTDNRYAGWSRISGLNKGWAIICQPDGSWAWNIGNGEYDGKQQRVEIYRKDYRPTAPRQKINDGEWHHLVFTVNREANETRLYFDGLNVGIYYMGPVKDLDSGLPVSIATDALGKDPELSFNGAIDNFHIYNRVLSAEDIAQNYEALVPMAAIPRAPEKRVEKLNLMSWNIWHGGRRRGKIIGPQQVIDLIKETNTDIVMMQETYGSGPLIADALGYYFYLSSANISILSKYPIEKSWVEYHQLWTGIATIQLSEEQKINLASIWLHYLPGRDTGSANATPEKLIAGEKKNRHREIKIILDKLKPQIEVANDIPLIIGGDFNSPSHLDWIATKKDWHNGLIVEWPVSKEMLDAGFKDSFREAHPNLDYASPSMTAEKLSYRIDYIYYKSKKLKTLSSDMFFDYKGVWPSDHPALITTLSIKK
ncbi:LamG-like jellyroll fold domain-containing protein [Flavivirga spongiicola]|uniref:Endonuclease/exonuclease/phosphatase family protein n=1 Tax=Flavivirga spongiicola TaxID=421621 RepID=A0ABU7XLT6_9FLAO|nr:LamG-like jellyroll fold domain-containing protein [Flavivirga sp. MEBiC05379]MDO5981373.1 LamG-like jellyroll fold domain-containing protein [Flavivirga sp. MEBiC05379]